MGRGINAQLKRLSSKARGMDMKASAKSMMPTFSPSPPAASVVKVARSLPRSIGRGRTRRSGRTTAELTELIRKSWINLCFQAPQGFCLETHPRGAGKISPPSAAVAAARSENTSAKPWAMDWRTRPCPAGSRSPENTIPKLG